MQSFVETLEKCEAEAGGDAKARTRARSNARASRPKAGSRNTHEASVAGVRITHPERILYPEQGITKLALARYYEAIEPWILPYVERRPLALLRCPEGRSGQCFFQKHPGKTVDPAVARFDIREKSGTEQYLYVRTLADLVRLVQIGVLEIHVWGSRVERLEKPDMLVFDLDPGDGVAWRDVMRGAREVAERLEQVGLATFVRTTGGKGLHVVAPLAPRADWDVVKEFARTVAEGQATDDPRRFTANMAKAKRHGRIFLDYLRNARGATAIASYSTRAREGAPVAVPVRWQELSSAMTSDRYNVENVRRRLGAMRSDPWDGFADGARPIDAAMLRAVGLRRAG